MSITDVQDRLAWLGPATGVFLVLVGVATLAGMPWQYSGGDSTLLQILGSLATIGVGVALAWLSR